MLKAKAGRPMGVVLDEVVALVTDRDAEVTGLRSALAATRLEARSLREALAESEGAARRAQQEAAALRVALGRPARRKAGKVLLRASPCRSCQAPVDAEGALLGLDRCQPCRAKLVAVLESVPQEPNP